MGLLGRTPAYDRSRILREAARVEASRRRRRAIALYRQVLAVEPGDGEVHGRIAPLLARTSQPFDAWLSFQTAGRVQLAAGNTSVAIVTYREATRLLPRELSAWVALAGLLRKEGHAKDALHTLLRGIRSFRGRSRRPQAIYLLRKMREIEPWHPGAVCALARLLARTQQRPEALLLLRNLAERVSGGERRQVRAAQLAIEPTLGNLCRWLGALLRGSSGSAVRAASR